MSVSEWSNYILCLENVIQANQYKKCINIIHWFYTSFYINLVIRMPPNSSEAPRYRNVFFNDSNVVFFSVPMEFEANFMIFWNSPNLRGTVLDDPVVDFDHQHRVVKHLSYIVRKTKIWIKHIFSSWFFVHLKNQIFWKSAFTTPTKLEPILWFFSKMSISQFPDWDVFPTLLNLMDSQNRDLGNH